MLFDPDVLELGPHRRSGVELQSQFPLERRALRGVGEVGDEPPVEVVPQVAALRDDDDIVPVVQFDQLREFILRDDRAEGLLFANLLGVVRDLLPGPLLADQAHPSALAALVIDESRHVGQFVAVADLMLVALHPPPVDLIRFRGSPFRAVLDAGVVGPADAEREPEIEIAELALLQDQEGVSLRRFLRGGLAVDRPVLHRPQRGVTLPARQVLSVEEPDHARRFRRRRLTLFGNRCHRHDRHNAGGAPSHSVTHTHLLYYGY